MTKKPAPKVFISTDLLDFAFIVFLLTLTGMFIYAAATL